jgi:hypothetical protein
VKLEARNFLNAVCEFHDQVAMTLARTTTLIPAGQEPLAMTQRLFDQSQKMRDMLKKWCMADPVE